MKNAICLAARDGRTVGSDFESRDELVVYCICKCSKEHDGSGSSEKDDLGDWTIGWLDDTVRNGKLSWRW